VLNPVPVATALSHRVISQTGPDLVIAIYGRDFAQNSVVRLNGYNLATTYVTSSVLQARITSAQRQGVGGVIITVFSPAPGGGSSSGHVLAKANFSDPKNIVSRHSGKAIDLAGGSIDDNAKIQQWDYSKSNQNQHWYLIPTGRSLEFWIVSARSNKCLTVLSANNGTSLVQRSCDFGNWQRFRVEEAGRHLLSGKYYSIQSVAYLGQALDVSNWSKENGAVIHIWRYGGGANQQWYIRTP